MKGILLAGGRGSRLYPITRAVCKQLLPIYDKPMIYYPLSILLLADIRDILLISTPEDQPRFQQLLGDGSFLGVSISYEIQKEPKGIAEAFCIGESFLGNDSVCLILGDNIFYGQDLMQTLHKTQKMKENALIFGYEVQNPSRYGVLAFDEKQQIVDIVEKPKDPPSNFAVTGLYFYDNQVIEIAKNLSPSARGELEITDVNAAYLKKRALQCHLFERGFAWLDTGTPEAMQKASNYVQTIQERQGIKIGCIEEIAYQMGFIDEEQLVQLARDLHPSEYGKYLLRFQALVSA